MGTLRSRHPRGRRLALPALRRCPDRHRIPGLTVTLTPAVSNDYLFRGISQTRNNWAFQGTADIQHESGFYIGAFINNAKFRQPYNDTRQELDALAGYRFELAGVAMDIGYIGYYYPGQAKAWGTQLNEYHELAVKASYTIDTVKLLAAFNYSPNFFGGRVAATTSRAAPT